MNQLVVPSTKLNPLLHALFGYSNANLISPSFGDIPYPSIGVISRFIVDTQKSDMNATGSKHWNLKFYIDGWSTPCLISNGWH